MLSRRAILQSFGRATVAMTAANYRSVTCAEGVNGTIRVGVIGAGARGKYLIANLPPSVRVTAVCDCAESRIASVLNPDRKFAKALAPFVERDSRTCLKFQDYRRIFDQPIVDAVIIATPDHHHAPATLAALDAGCDVYLEKPLTLRISEGREITRKAQQNAAVLQVGSQQRTMEWNRFACEFVRGGGLGKIRRAVLPNYPGPLVMPNYFAEPVPDGLDWDLFLGNASRRPHHPRLWVKDEFKVDGLLWRGWDLYCEYSGHMMTNWGAHQVDMMQFALGKDRTGPTSIESVPTDSAHSNYEPWSEKTPRPGDPFDRRFRPVRMRYGDGIEVEFRGGNGPITIEGEKGSIKIRRNDFQVHPPNLVRQGPDPALKRKWVGTGFVARPHLENWLDCMRSRSTPNAPAEYGHRTATVCHLANLSRQFDVPLNWDPIAERFVGNEDANRLL